MNDTVSSLEQWVRYLPSSQMVYPAQLHNRLKYAFWRLYTPLHPVVRGTAERFGFTSSYFVPRVQRRQDFLIGRMTPGQTMREFISHCISRGYGNHFVAWRDEGELVSLRYVEDFVHQYHLRIFEDGEVRGHYEYTPECYPISHLKAIGQEDRRSVFYEHLGDRIVREN